MTEIDKLVEECARLARDGLDEDGTFDVRSPDECSLDDCEQAEWDATVRAARAVIRRTLEFAAGRAKVAWLTTDCGAIGDAEYGEALCNEISEALRSLAKAEG